MNAGMDADLFRLKLFSSFTRSEFIRDKRDSMINELLGNEILNTFIHFRLSANGEQIQSIYCCYNSYFEQIVHAATAHFVSVLCTLCTELCSQLPRSIHK